MQPVREKHILQKLSAFTYRCSFVMAILCAGILLIYMDDLSKVYKASFAASSFFFFCVGIVLDVISSTNLPNFYNEINKEE
ncbi:hypothetical protein MOVI109754_12320 [Moritella viscosa]